MSSADPLGPLSDLNRQLTRRLVRVCLLLGLLLAGGTLGYCWIEGWGWFDALYMTVITAGTIGYGETHPLTTPGRWFTIGLILVSIVVIAYAASTLAAFVFEGQYQRLLLGRRMDSRIAKLSQHVVVCGAGRTGLHVAEELFKTRTPFVVVDRDAQAVDRLRQLGDVPFVLADATQDDTLMLSGIQRAKGLISALDDDRDNVFVTLSARALNPRLRIVSRLVQEDNRPKLVKAGADEIVATDAIGGLRIASVMIRPAVVSFLDRMLRQTDTTLRFEELPIDEIPGLAGKTLGTADLGRRTGLLVLAVRGPDGGFRFNPGASYQLAAGDVLVVFGTAEQLLVARGRAEPAATTDTTSRA